MKIKVLILVATLFLLNKSFCQTAMVENRLFSAQAGFFGIWASYEKQLKPRTTLKTEFGFDNGVWGNTEGTGYFFIPALIAEPRWYYNLSKRDQKSKNTSGNSGNYISLFLRHHPDWFVISNYEVGSVVPDLSIIPTWGIHRKIGRNICFETSAGLGYRFYFTGEPEPSSNYGEIDFNITVRFGYNF